MYYDDYAGWTFHRSYTQVFGELIAGCAFDEELAGPGGVHIHVWLPPAIAADAEKRAEVEAEAARKRDLVSMSWSEQTPEIDAWINAGTPPKGYIRANLDALVQWHEDDRGMAKVYWGKGKRLTIDAFSLSALAAVAKALRPDLRAKLAGWVEESPERCAWAVEKAFGLLKKHAA